MSLLDIFKDIFETQEVVTNTIPINDLGSQVEMKSDGKHLFVSFDFENVPEEIRHNFDSIEVLNYGLVFLTIERGKYRCLLDGYSGRVMIGEEECPKCHTINKGDNVQIEKINSERFSISCRCHACLYDNQYYFDSNGNKKYEGSNEITKK